jgi:hypothetical protein
MLQVTVYSYIKMLTSQKVNISSIELSGETTMEIRNRTLVPFHK